MSSGRKATASRKKQNLSKAKSPLHEDVRILLLLAVCILLFLGNLGLGGIAGDFVRQILFGIFGLPAYVFPFVLFVVGAVRIVHAKGQLPLRKLFGFLGLFIFSCALFQLFSGGYQKASELLEYYKISSYDHTGGGIVGGFLFTLFRSFFGFAGAAVLIIIFLIIFTIIMTQKPLMAALRDSGKEKFLEARERHLQKEALRAERKEERRQRIEQRKAEMEARRTELENQKEEQKLLAESAGPQLLEDARVHKDRNKDENSDQNKDNVEFNLSGGEISSAETSSLSFSDEKAPAEGGDEDALLKGDVAIGDITVSGVLTDSDAVSAPGDLPDAPPDILEDTAPREDAEQAEEAFAERPSPANTSGQARKKEGESSDEQEVRAALVKSASDDQKVPYIIPSLRLLNKPKAQDNGDSADHLKATAATLQETLHSFGIDARISHISRGPTVTRYEMVPESGVRVSRILSLTDDIKLALAATDIRIEAPIPGKSAIGIEVPNKTNVTVPLGEMFASRAFRTFQGKIAFAVGKNIAGQSVVTDLAKMPHVLIAGATGSGKSVCINTLIMSILYKYSPEQVRLIMIDPKMVELSIYNGIPHLFIPVVTDPKKAAGALNWGVAEMTDRYRKFAEAGVRDMEGYNQKVEDAGQTAAGEGEEENPLAQAKKMPRIVIVVDELADLMMVAQHEVEDAIVRLSQLARAAGIHLVIATQRPSVNVITGLIKANMPSRIALAVSSGVDSRTILDMNGAERLLGKGDMLFAPQNLPKPIRIQGAFVTDDEIQRVVRFLKEKSGKHRYDQEIEKQINSAALKSDTGGDPLKSDAEEMDAYFADAGKLIIQKDKASIGMLQRAFRIGFNRAARIMDQLADVGVVGEEEGTKPRKILMSMEQFENYLEENG